MWQIYYEEIEKTEVLQWELCLEEEWTGVLELSKKGMLQKNQ